MIPSCTAWLPRKIMFMLTTVGDDNERIAKKWNQPSNAFSDNDTNSNFD